MINQVPQELLSDNVMEFIREIENRNDMVCIAMYSAADATNKQLTEINEMLKQDKRRLENKINTASKIMVDIKNKDKAYDLLYKDFFKDFIPSWDASASQSLRHARRNAEKWASKKFGWGYKKDLRHAPAVSNYIMKVLENSSKGCWVLENKNNDIIWRRFENILQEWVKLMFFKEGNINIDDF